jgi:hypothetical protein
MAAGEAFYPGIAAGDAASIGSDGVVRPIVTPNATYQVYEIADTAFTTPLTIKTPAGQTATGVPVGALPILPDVYVVSPNFAHNWKSGSFVFRRDSQDAKDQAVAAALFAAQQAALSAGDSLQQVQTLIASGGGGGGGTGGLVADTANPGMYLTTGSGLLEDPANPGIYLTGA